MGDKEQFAITFWGVRGSTPCANKENMEFGGNTTCVQFQIPGADEIVILDSGTGIRNLGNRLVQESQPVKGRIFITHPHWDHIQGFPFFKPLYCSSNHFKIHMPSQLNGGCKEVLSSHLTKTFFPVTLEMIDANLEYVTQEERKKQYQGYAVEYMLASHTINTAIYKIQIGEKQIVFGPDNELKPRGESESGDRFYDRLKEFSGGADVLIHDAQYNLESYQSKQGWGHSAWETVVDFARQAGIRHLFLTHHDPDSGDEKLRRLNQFLKRRFGREFDSIQLAREGETFVF